MINLIILYFTASRRLTLKLVALLKRKRPIKKKGKKISQGISFPISGLTAPGKEAGVEARARGPTRAGGILLCIALPADTIWALDMLDIVWSAFSLAA